VTDVEVLQEILHRYVAIGRRDAIQPAFDALLGIVDHVFAVEKQDAERAKDILHGNDRISARDALHVAIMQRHGISLILTFDKAFSDVPGIERVS
jgi:predicted nucleic acid-binding protein